MIKKITGILLPMLLLAVEPGAQAYENPIFAYTHLLPSPFTLPSGRLVVGTDIAYGITDFLQIGTNILRDAYKVYNATAKVSLLDYPEFAVGLQLGFESYNYQDIDSANPDVQVTSWLPGIVAGYEVVPYLAWFVGGNLNFTQANLITSSLTTSGFVQGATVESDLSWAYWPGKKTIGNVLSGGATYDITYKIYGVGISHYWRGFHIGVHYYPNASQYRIQPILAGGAVVDL